MVYYTTSSSKLAIILCVPWQEQSVPRRGKWRVNYTPFPKTPRILGSRHYIFVFFTLDSWQQICCPKWTDGQRQVPFLKLMPFTESCHSTTYSHPRIIQRAFMQRTRVVLGPESEFCCLSTGPHRWKYASSVNNKS